MSNNVNLSDKVISELNYIQDNNESILESIKIVRDYVFDNMGSISADDKETLEVLYIFRCLERYFENLKV